MGKPLPVEVANLLAEEIGAPGYYGRARSLLQSVIPADSVAWVDLDMKTGEGATYGLGSRRVDALFLRRIAESFHSDPVIGSYVRRPLDVTPRRMSDVSGDRTWLATRSYSEAFADVGGKRLLSIVVELTPQPRGVGWMFLRRGRDFNDEDLRLAQQLQPVLSALERIERRLGTGTPFEDRSPQAPQLTRREHDVLILLATGASATHIADRLAISVRTVHKHLEHIYDKLGCRDRLTAARTARALGLP